ncbi:MFS transporter [Actinomadura macrotermitis]|uniref:Multidrug resistance protein Stp n=1 Tax=Actinomadura macrotermitis TaxID=2585200 RepID=A0A7K0C6I4_9ACTN|nr:MFS transporter [Actinomadura macrotermitis]MQY08956.1 Multidrug resistance protein Stp [Actinomadura macrotermitis]
MPKVAARPVVVLAVVSLGVVLSSLDLFVANVALPAMAADLHPSDLGELSWVLNAYAIVFAALLVPAGRLADRTGHRTGFLAGTALFVAASAACAAATSVPMLVGFRAVQAVGAALLMPTSLGLVLAAYPPAGRPGAARAWAVTGSVAAAVAPVVAGPLVQVSWRWVFLVNLPVGAVALVLGRRLLPETARERGPLPDVLGAALLTAGIGALALGLVKGGAWGWSSGRVAGALAAAAVLVAVFFARSARHPSPVFEPGLLRDRGFAVATAAMLVSSAAFGGMLLSVVLWMQDAWQWSALRAGFGIAPGPAMVPFCSVLAGRLIPRLGPARIVVAGAVVFAAGLGWWAASAGAGSGYASGMLGGMVLTGIGFGLLMPTLFGSAAGSLPPQRFATGAGVVSMVRQIGMTVGVALLVAVLGTPHGADERSAAFRTAWIVLAAVALAAAVVGSALPRPRRAPRDPAAARPIPFEKASGR